MTGLSDESVDLFRAGRAGMSPTTADRERVRARLAATLGAAAVGAAVTTTTAPAAATAASGATAKGGAAALVAKIAISVLVVAAGASAVVWRAPSTPSTVPAAEPPAAAATAEAILSAAPPAPALSTSARAPRRAKPHARTPAAAPAAADTSGDTNETGIQEARLVAKIDAALRGGDPSTALRLADEHARTFPRGALIEEREGGRAIARCMTGSRASADAFLAAHPRSPMRGRVIAACGKSER